MSVIRDFIIRENIIPFTNINLALFALCYFKSYINFISDINYDYLYSICYCWNHIIFFTFNAAYFMDNTSFKRMAIRKRIPMPVFHIGNMVLHNLPLLYVNIHIPNNVTICHSLVGCLSNLVWCYWATFGTFDIKYVYVYMKKEQQVKLYILNITSIVYVPLIFYTNKYIRTAILVNNLNQ
jgi:hypothetical protein